MVKLHITKPLQKFMNNEVNIQIDADSYLNLYQNLVNIYPDLRKCVREIHNNRCFDLWFVVNGKNLPYEELLLPVKKDAIITFVPLISGSSEDIAMIGIGLALIALTIVTFGSAAPLTALAASGALATASFGTIAAAAVGQLAFSIGLSLVVAGVMGIVAGPPPQKNAQVNDSSIRSNNETFGNLQNTTAVGTPIPLIFGQIRIPGQLISGHIRNISHSAGETVNLVDYL